MSEGDQKDRKLLRKTANAAMERMKKKREKPVSTTVIIISDLAS